MNTTKNRISWLATVLIAGLAIAYITLYYLPNQRSLAALQEQLLDKQNYVAQSNLLTKAIETTQQELNYTTAYTKKWLQYAPTKDRLFGLFRQISKLAKESGAKTTRFDPLPVVNYHRFRKVPLEISCTGSFAQISCFLETIEKLPRALWIKELSMSQSGQPGKNVTCELTLAIFADIPDISDQTNNYK